MILVSGFNVYPNEVEAWWSRTGVLEVAAVRSHERAGEIVALFVVRKDRRSRGGRRRALPQVAHRYKVPKRVYFRDELPKTTSQDPARELKTS